jgi:hypothetical protein
MSNPYGDEPYTTAWRQGYEHGQSNPSDTDPQAPDFSSWGYDDDVTGYCAQVWREGALSGREAAASSSSSGGSSGSSSEPGGGASGDGTVQLPADVAEELANMRAYYPESFFLLDSGDGETFLRSIGVEYIPTSDDDDPPAVA